MSLNFSEPQAGWVIKSGYLHLSDRRRRWLADVLGLKAGAYYPGNQQRGLPSHNATMMMIDPETGLTAAISAANTIINMRTAADGAVAAKWLARRDASTVAMIGAGEQAYAQLNALFIVLPSLIRANVWTWNHACAESFAGYWNARGLTVSLCESVESAVRGADVIVATTPSRRPLVEKERVRPGTHINAIGSDAAGKQEISTALVQ